MLTFPLQCFLNDKNNFHINFTCSFTFQWKLLPLQNFDRDLGEISKSRRPKTRRDSRRDLGEILKSQRPKTRRDSRQDLKISSRFSAEISMRPQNLGGQKLAENLDKISSKILARSQSLGSQNLAKNLGKTSSKILSRYQNLGDQKNLAEEAGSFLYFKMSILRFRRAFHKFFD